MNIIQYELLMQNRIPQLANFSIEELNELAMNMNLQQKYGIDVDILNFQVVSHEST